MKKEKKGKNTEKKCPQADIKSMKEAHHDNQLLRLKKKKTAKKEKNVDAKSMKEAHHDNQLLRLKKGK